MKKKKLKKIAKLIYQEVNSRESKIRTSETEQFQFEYDEHISEKVYNFILNLVRLESKINIEIKNEYISLYCNLSQFKSYNTKNPTKDEYLEVFISKSGFKIIKNHQNQICFSDSSIFEKIKPSLIERYKKVSKENVCDIINDTLILTNLSRENNLDEILKD